MKLKWIVIPVFILVIVSIFIFFTKMNEDLPENLIGKWTTSTPGYQDRFIEITKETLTYGLGGDKKDVYFISSIKESLEGKNILYTISYKNTDGLKFTRSFNYDSEHGGTIQFKHQEHIGWLKKKNTVIKENYKTDQN